MCAIHCRSQSSDLEFLRTGLPVVGRISHSSKRSSAPLLLTHCYSYSSSHPRASPCALPFLVTGDQMSAPPSASTPSSSSQDYKSVAISAPPPKAIPPDTKADLKASASQTPPPAASAADAKLADAPAPKPFVVVSVPDDDPMRIEIADWNITVLDLLTLIQTEGGMRAPRPPTIALSLLKPLPVPCVFCLQPNAVTTTTAANLCCI